LRIRRARKALNTTDSPNRGTMSDWGAKAYATKRQTGSATAMPRRPSKKVRWEARERTPLFLCTIACDFFINTLPRAPPKPPSPPNSTPRGHVSCILVFAKGGGERHMRTAARSERETRAPHCARSPLLRAPHSAKSAREIGGGRG